MNASQRKFLIEKITKEAKDRIRELEKQKEEIPSRSNYLFKAALNGELQIQSREHILEVLKQKALKAKEGANWLSEDRMGWEKENTVRLPIEDLLVIPKDWRREHEGVIRHNMEIQKQINEIQAHLNRMEVQITLASSSKLQHLINEVDNWGDVKLIDTKLKALPA